MINFLVEGHAARVLTSWMGTECPVASQGEPLVAGLDITVPTVLTVSALDGRHYNGITNDR